MTQQRTVSPSSRDWIILLAITAIGFAFRIASAQGGLWLDEAWSATHAAEAATPIGVFLGINHDNNHHLNSLWMQAVGIDAAPMLQRALAIASGTASIVVVGFFAASRGRSAMAITAWLFALSPILVTLGSEARGYAPMLLFLLLAIGFVDRWLDGDTRYARPPTIAILFALGMLSQLTMIVGICALVGWAVVRIALRSNIRTALAESWAMFWPGVAAALAILALVFGAAAASENGFRFGSYTPFDAVDLLHAIVEMLGFTFGFRWIDVWPVVFVPVALILTTRATIDRAPFYWLAAVAFPTALAVLHVGNVGYPRYYIVMGIALLLLAAETGALGWRAGGWRRVATAIALAAFTGSALADDSALLREQRGDPARAIAAIVAREPDGARIHVERETGTAMLSIAARQASYRLVLSPTACDPGTDFVFFDRYRGEPLLRDIERCGRHFRVAAHVEPAGLSGTHWTLYHAAP